MAVRDEKMNNFLAAINEYAEEQRSRIQAEVEDFKRQELQKAEDEILYDSYELIQREMDAMRTETSQDISCKETESRKLLFAKRQEITAGVFAEAEARLREFARSEKYPELLDRWAGRLSPIFPAEDTVLLVKKEDLIFSDRLCAAFGKPCRVCESEEIHIGGLKAFSETLGILADETFDSKLENQREWFAENSGMTIA